MIVVMVMELVIIDLLLAYALNLFVTAAAGASSVLITLHAVVGETMNQVAFGSCGVRSGRIVTTALS